MDCPSDPSSSPPEMGQVALVVLAAGRSRRMGSPKGLVRWRGQPLLEHLLGPPLLGHLADVVVVLGHHADRIRGLVERAGYRFVVNPDPDRGRTGSVQAGLGAIRPGVAAVFIHPVDCPVIRPGTYVALVEAVGSADVAVPRYRARNGHPPLVAAGMIPRILEAHPQVPLRDVFRGPQVRREYVDVDDPGVLVNVDRPEDLQQLEHLGGSGSPLRD